MLPWDRSLQTRLFRTAPTRNAEFVSRSDASMSAENHASKTPSIGVLSPNPTAAGDPALTRMAYSVGETALMLELSQDIVRCLICRGLLRPCRALRYPLIPRGEIDRFLEETLNSPSENRSPQVGADSWRQFDSDPRPTPFSAPPRPWRTRQLLR